MMTSREEYVQWLRGLTDAELENEAVARIHDYSRLSRGTDRWHAENVAGLCWRESLRRNLGEIYTRALAAVDAERKAAQEFNRRQLQALHNQSLPQIKPADKEQIIADLRAEVQQLRQQLHEDNR